MDLDLEIANSYLTQLKTTVSQADDVVNRITVAAPASRAKLLDEYKLKRQEANTHIEALNLELIDIDPADAYMFNTVHSLFF